MTHDEASGGYVCDETLEKLAIGHASRKILHATEATISWNIAAARAAGKAKAENGNAQRFADIVPSREDGADGLGAIPHIGSASCKSLPKKLNHQVANDGQLVNVLVAIKIGRAMPKNGYETVKLASNYRLEFCLDRRSSELACMGEINHPQDARHAALRCEMGHCREWSLVGEGEMETDIRLFDKRPERSGLVGPIGAACHAACRAYPLEA